MTPIRPALAFFAMMFMSSAAMPEMVNRLVVDVTTADKTFAGTDNAVYLVLPGFERQLDDPDRDDFERGNTDSFEFDLTGSEIDFSLLRQLREVTLRKPANDFFGGGWDLEGLTIRVEFAESYLPDPADPIFTTTGIGVELDEDRRFWTATADDSGWNLPAEPAPWPPCMTADIEGVGVIEPDSDCDGLGDSSDDTFDQPQDSDGDDLPDLYESQTGTNPLDPDLDDDGWWDGNNQRHSLVLRAVECNGDVAGTDSIYLEIEDVRYPETDEVDGVWRMRDDTTEPTALIVDSRATGGGVSVPMEHFATRVTFREIGTWQDPAHNETVETVRWPQDGPIVIETADADCDYRFTFQSFEPGGFLDPLPAAENGDADEDGRRDDLEFDISSQDARLRPPGEPAPDGYDGLADPQRGEVFLEIDHVGSDARIHRDTKVEVASRYHFQNVQPRFDDGYLGGGGLAEPYATEVTLDEVDDYKANPDNFWCERRDHYQYALFVDRTKGFWSDLFFGGNGRADRPGKNLVISRNTQILDYGTIVFIHELGHNFSLCHLDGGRESPFLLPTCNADGTVPGGPFPDPEDDCRHYCGVPGDDDTAMGDTVGGASIIAGAVGGALIGAGIGAAFGPWGALAGGLIGGFIGGVLGFFNSDAGQRTTDYHPLEWQMLRFGTDSSDDLSGLQFVRWPDQPAVCDAP
jgi:hypothetical protein